MKILLSGYCCGPGLGSEPGLTWNWAWQLSQRHQVWAVVHPVYREDIESFLRHFPNPNLRFEYVALSPSIASWFSEKSEIGLRLHYVLWLRAAYRTAARLHGEVSFDLTHHVSWATMGAMPLLWKLPVPFFWGPVGGAQSAPRKFLKYFGNDRLAQLLRSARIGLTASSPFYRRALRHCSLILASESETKDWLEEAGAKSVKLFLDGGVADDWFVERVCPASAVVPRESGRSTVVLHWCGRLEPRKGLALAIEGLAAAGDIDVRLEVSGRGPEREKCEQLATRLGVANKVKFLGFLDHESLLCHLRRSDALLVTSLRDSFVTVTLEAAANGLPTITLNHQGTGSLLPDDACWKVPVTDPEATAAALGQTIRDVATNPKARLERGSAALQFAKDNTWERRARQMEAWYEQYR
jgi:glycosyltransferase involved in cell wall biosynthesis